jgi:hypothetical protein
VQPAAKKRVCLAGSKNGVQKEKAPSKPNQRLANVNADLLRQLEAANARIQELQRPQPVMQATDESTGGLGGQDPEFSQRYIEMKERMDTQYAEEGPLVDPALLPRLSIPE